jgi:hypothetical protein
MPAMTRRDFLGRLESAAAAGVFGLTGSATAAQTPGERPVQAADVVVLNPATRVPVSFIIDDSTCLVNLNRFAMPQFDEAHGGRNKVYARDWRSWPVEIPDSFVRTFGTWCAEHGVKGKYSIVPYPACVGRLDRGLPGWTRRELADSIELVRTLMVPNWDIHPEMVTHTRVIDLSTGHPYADHSTRFMENWEWTTGRSADEIGAYLTYALRILHDVGLPSEGVTTPGGFGAKARPELSITTPGGFGAKARPELSIATLQAVRDVYKAEIPHYFRDAVAEGPGSVAPRVENARGLDGSDPQCVVSVVACTSDWTGGWDNTPPGGADKFITADLASGRMVEVIERGDVAVMMSHWTGIYWNGQELGFKVLQEVVRRLHARFDHLVWMKLSEIARYAAARTLTRIDAAGGRLEFRAPFACPAFTFRVPPAGVGAVPRFHAAGVDRPPLRRVQRTLDLSAGTWCDTRDGRVICLDLPRGRSEVVV